MLDTSKGGILYTPGKKYEKQLSRKNKYRQQMMKVTWKLFNKNLWGIQKPHLTIEK